MDPEILDIHDVAPAAFAPVLEAESGAWLQNLHWDFSASARVVMTLLEEKRLSGFTLRREGSITGFCFYFFDGSKALIGDLFASPAREGLEEACLLLDRTITALMKSPGVSRIEAQLPHFPYHALSMWFRSRFFDGYVRQFMSTELRDSVGALRASAQPNPGRMPPANPVDFSLETWRRKYDRSAARLLFRTYRHHIDAAINDQYSSLEGTTRLVENIVNLRGCGDFLESASHVLVYRPTGEVAGLLGATAVRPGTAHIAQVAVAAEFQKAGLGRMLLETSMERVREQGFEEVSLTVTSLNSGAVRLYERLGFRVLRDFGAFTWQRS